MIIDPLGETPLYVQIYEQCKTAILSGVYPSGGKLPPIRKLAEDLNVARNTVEAAYRQLTQEGFVASKPGSGYVVERLDRDELYAATSMGTTAFAHGPTQNVRSDEDIPAIMFDFTYGDLQKGSFPADIWRRLTTDVLFGDEAAYASCYNDPLGDFALRSCIADHLKVSRGVMCDPHQVVIQAGTQASIQNLLQLFDPAKDAIAMEEPGYDGVRMVFENGGFDVIACPVNESRDTYIESLKRSDAKIAFVTPSNQFPTGVIMPMQSRHRLLDWAIANNAYIIEDDYCREFRYNIRATPSLQSLDAHHRVVYMGTFSKALSPALRMNYLILPPNLLTRWQEHFGRYYSSVPWLSQTVLRRFIEQGYWEKHLRKAQTRNKHKRETLIDALKETMGEHIDIVESGAGLHLLIGPRDDRRTQEDMIKLAENAGVRVYGTHRYWMAKNHPYMNYVLLGFSAIEEDHIQEGVAALAQAWFG